jgi:hypothetical protein
MTQPSAPDPVVEAYKKNLDLRQNLQRSIQERLEALMELQRFAKELQRSGRRIGTR